MDRVGSTLSRCVVLALVTIIGGCTTYQGAGAMAPPVPPAAVEPAPALPVAEAPAAASPPPPAPPPARVESVGSGQHLYKLWYATNRLPVHVNGELVDYAPKRDAKRIHYGSLYAEIPENFLDTMTNRGFFSRLFPTSEAKLRLTKPVDIDSQVFIKQLKSDLDSVPLAERQVLVYLHGFNTTFKEAAQRAASIGYQLKIPTTAFFSWPSQGGMLKYAADKDLAEVSRDSIADFIIKTYAESGAKRIHLIAHSMGNHALLGAMHRPKMQQAIKDGLRFGQVILAAPDVDTDNFINDAGILATVAERVSLYVSDGDAALMASVKVAAGRSRAGLRPPVVVVNNIDTVDVSSTNLTFTGHDYVSQQIAVLNDMHALILHNDPPWKRPRIVKKSDYWELH
jgi:esterase/lipase superfamily enzyme